MKSMLLVMEEHPDERAQREWAIRQVVVESSEETRRAARETLAKLGDQSKSVSVDLDLRSH